MEINVKLTLDEKTEKVVGDLTLAINNLATSKNSCNCSSSPEILNSVDIDTLHSHVESTTDEDTNPSLSTPTVEKVESEKPQPKIDYGELRILVKEKAVEKAKKGFRPQVKELSAKYGVSAVSELKDEQLEDYMKELEAIA